MSKWALYIKPICLLLKLALASRIHKTSSVSDVFARFDELLSPWMVFYSNCDQKEPWSNTPLENEAGSCVVDMLVTVIKELPLPASDVITASWRFYSDKLCRVDIPHVTQIIHLKFGQLQWQHLKITTETISAMQTLMNKNGPLFAPFIAAILSKSDTQNICTNISSSPASELSTNYVRFLQLVLDLLRIPGIMNAQFKPFVYNCSTMDWSSIGVAQLEAISTWIVGNCDAASLLDSLSAVCNLILSI